MLQVKGNKIVDEKGTVVRLRGVCAGGWMNMENFINGYPGDERGTRAAMAKVLGKEKAGFFFKRFLYHFFTEEDVKFIKQAGANVVRLPVNYRHFENDMKPFEYLPSGFKRLDEAVKWCAKHGLYVILDLHAVQGWQSTDWHCDNSSRHSFFWEQLQFQDRFTALWEEFARRYKGSNTIAGYNVMNEPASNTPNGRFSNVYTPDWANFNKVYRRVVKAIRRIDPGHIIFLEGDYYSQRFEKMEAPFAANLVYSSHNYTPTDLKSRYSNLKLQKKLFLAHEGTRFAKKYNVPLWVGEFGGQGAGALDDQLSVFEEYKAHWTVWTYKDFGTMGAVHMDPKSKYSKLLAPLMEAKRALKTEAFTSGYAVNKIMQKLAGVIVKHIDKKIDFNANLDYLSQATLSGYTASLMQPYYAQLFKGKTNAEIDSILESFVLKNCKPHQGMMEALIKNWSKRP